MQNKFSKDKVESIMGSLGGMQRAAAPNFFYTRLRAKMQPAEEKRAFFMLRPAFITAALAVLLVANIVSLLQTKQTPKTEPTATYSKPATIESFATAYDMNSGSVYE